MRVTGRGAARKGDQMRFLVAELASLARPRSVIDGGLKSFPTYRFRALGAVAHWVDQQHIGYLTVPKPLAAG